MGEEREPTAAEYAELVRLRENMMEHTRLYEAYHARIHAREENLPPPPKAAHLHPDSP